MPELRTLKAWQAYFNRKDLIKIMFIFLDESGDLGFGKTGSSSYFCVTLLICENNETAKHVEKAVKHTLRRKLNHKKQNKRIVKELKGSETHIGIKRSFLEKMPSDGWYLHTIIVNKAKIVPSLQKAPSKLYNYITKEIVKTLALPQTLNILNLIVDKSKNREEIKDFDKYIATHFEAELPFTRLMITHQASEANAGLQAVDLFCWGVKRFYERKDADWFSDFSHKIKVTKKYFF